MVGVVHSACSARPLRPVRPEIVGPMDERHWQPTCTRPRGLVRPVRTDAAGQHGPTRGQARSRAWRRSAYGWYVPAYVDSSVVEQRILEQAVRLASTGAITGWAALRWRGAAYFDGLGQGGRVVLPVPMMRLAGGRFERDPAVAWRRGQVLPTEIEVVGGIPCATVQRALFEEMRFSSLRHAVRAMELAATAGLISTELMRIYAAYRRTWTGIPLVREALKLACDHSRSGPETDLKLTWVLDAGLDPPLVNQPVFSMSGRLLGYPDVFDPGLGVGGEYEGIDHKSRDRHRKDVARAEDFRSHGVELFHVVGGDLQVRGLVAGRIHVARQRAREIPASRKSWTLTPPPWWRSEPSLHEMLVGRGMLEALTHR